MEYKFRKLPDKKSGKYQRFLERETGKIQYVPRISAPKIGTPPTLLSSKLPNVLDQGQLGTCVANAVSSAIFCSLGGKGQTNNNNSATLISRCHLQFAENMVSSGLNPGFVVGNPMLTQVGVDEEYNGLFAQGAWYAFSVISLMASGIAQESTWNYPLPSTDPFQNFMFPNKNSNPLIISNYNPGLNNRFFVKSAMCYSANFGPYQVIANENPNYGNWQLSQNYAGKLYNLYIRESWPLFDDENRIAHQDDFINYIVSSINAGMVCLISFQVEYDFLYVDETGLYKPSGEEIDENYILGGHANAIIGVLKGATLKTKFPNIDVNLDDDYFMVRNSWGSGWGDMGNWYVSFNDFRNTVVSGGMQGYINTLFTQSVYTLIANFK